jgi:hypothetical protein
MLNVDVSVEGNGNAVRLDVNVYPDALLNFGKKLQSFPSSVSDEAVLEMGSPEIDAYSWLKFRAYAYDGSGHTALQVSAIHNPHPRLQANIHFPMRMEAAALNALGERIEKWAIANDEPFEFEYIHHG